MHLVHNERIKLRATLLNTLGIAFIVVGGLTPLVGLIYGSEDLSPRFPTYLFIIVPFGWILFGVALHQSAHLILANLRE